MHIFISYLIVTFIVFCVFGLLILAGNFIKNKIISRYLLQIISFLAFLIVYIIKPADISVFNFNNVFSLHNLILIILTVCPAAIIAFYSDKSKPENKFTALDFLDGVGMEIPQRLLAQNLFCVMVVNTKIFGVLALPVLLNGLLWVQFIIFQEIMNKNKISKKVVLDVIASIWFSIFGGMLYYRTGNILATMLCHGAERYIKYLLKSKFGVAKTKIM